MANDSRPALPAVLKEWLVATYLSQPDPERYQLEPDAEPEPLVLVLSGTFTTFLRRNRISISRFEEWRRAGWLEDMMLDSNCWTRLVGMNKQGLPITTLLHPGKHRLVGIRQTVIDAPIDPGPPPDEGGTPVVDPFAGLREFARNQLKGQERAVIEALCSAGGEMPIADLAQTDGVGWDDPFQGLRNVQQRLNPKLKALKWRLVRQNNEAKLVSMKS